MRFTAGDIADQLGGKVRETAHAPHRLSGRRPRPGGRPYLRRNRTFLNAPNKAQPARIVDKDFTSERKVLIRSKRSSGLCQSGAAFYPEPGPPTGIHSSAIISEKPSPSEACIGAHVIIADGAKIGARTVCTETITWMKTARSARTARSSIMSPCIHAPRWATACGSTPVRSSDRTVRLRPGRRAPPQGPQIGNVEMRTTPRSARM